jgi:hypothetical protein
MSEAKRKGPTDFPALLATAGLSKSTLHTNDCVHKDKSRPQSPKPKYYSRPESRKIARNKEPPLTDKQPTLGYPAFLP